MSDPCSPKASSQGSAASDESLRCAFTGCPKPAAMHPNRDRRSPWCQGHLKQRQRVGEAGMKPLRERLNRDTCAFPGCPRKPRTRPQKSRPRSLYCARHKEEA